MLFHSGYPCQSLSSLSFSGREFQISGKVTASSAAGMEKIHLCTFSLSLTFLKYVKPVLLGHGQYIGTYRPKAYRIHCHLSGQPFEDEKKAYHLHFLMPLSLEECHTAGMKYLWLLLILLIFSIFCLSLKKEEMANIFLILQI